MLSLCIDGLTERTGARSSIGYPVPYRPNSCRTAAGSVPWVWNIATVRRSIPNATQPVCARLAVHVLDVPGRAEMVAVIVEAHAGGRLRFGAQRDQQLEFQRLLLLADRLHLADAAEERIARIVDLEGQAEVARDTLRALNQAISKCRDVVRPADTDIFAHPKRLQPVEMTGRFAAEAVGRDVEAQATRRQRATGRRDRVNRITGRRREHEIGGRKRCGPVAAGV